MWLKLHSNGKISKTLFFSYSHSFRQQSFLKQSIISKISWRLIYSGRHLVHLTLFHLFLTTFMRHPFLICSFITFLWFYVFLEYLFVLHKYSYYYFHYIMTLSHCLFNTADPLTVSGVWGDHHCSRLGKPRAQRVLSDLLAIIKKPLERQCPALKSIGNPMMCSHTVYSVCLYYDKPWGYEYLGGLKCVSGL